jgi:hypothetical protein
MTTAARRYSRHRWLVYGEIGAIVNAANRLSTIATLVPSTRHQAKDLEIALDNLRLILIEHLREMKATGSWRKL